MIQFNPDRLNAVILANGTTEYKLADRIGYPRQMINKWTAGHDLPPIRALMAICDTFSVTPDFFFPPEIPATIHAPANEQELQAEVALLSEPPAPEPGKTTRKRTKKDVKAKRFTRPKRGRSVLSPA